MQTSRSAVFFHLPPRHGATARVEASPSASPASSILVLEDPPPQLSLHAWGATGPSAPGLSARLAGLATAARSSAQVGLAIGAAVATGLSAKAGYMAAMMAASPVANAVVSTGIVVGSTVVVHSGVGALIEGARGLVRGGPALSPMFVQSMQALGVAAYLCAMLGSAYRAMDDGDQAPLGAYMLANAAGQVLAGVVTEVMASALVPHATVPTELIDAQGAVIAPGSPQALALRPVAETALAAGQIVTHAALMWVMLDKIPLVQLALGAPEGFRPGQESAQDQALASLGVAAMFGASEFGRIAIGGMSMALAQTLQGATIRAASSTSSASPQLAAGNAAPLSRWQQCCDGLDRAAERIGLGADARGRMATYVPLLNLYADTLTTGPGSGFIIGLAKTMKRPIAQVAVGVANFTLSLLNVVDTVLRYRPAPARTAAEEPLQASDFFSSPRRGSSSEVAIEVGELRE